MSGKTFQKNENDETEEQNLSDRKLESCFNRLILYLVHDYCAVFIVLKFVFCYLDFCNNNKNDNDKNNFIIFSPLNQN